MNGRRASTGPSDLLVVTDLDGCLLDETTYDFEAARPALERLARMGVPLVLATSKTESELAELRESLRPAALVVENGGAVLVRAGNESGGSSNGARVRGVVLGKERDVLALALREIEAETGARIRSFAQMGCEEVASRTGLDPASATRALQRRYDEPFLLEDDRRAAAVAVAARSRGLRVTRGGRFWHLTGDTDKGRALRALLDIYAEQGRHFTVVGLGDSANDLSLLREVDRPVVVPRPGGVVDPELRGALRSAEQAPLPGPPGWNAAVLAVLEGGRLPSVAESAR